MTAIIITVIVVVLGPPERVCLTPGVELKLEEGREFQKSLRCMLNSNIYTTKDLISCSLPLLSLLSFLPIHDPFSNSPLFYPRRNCEQFQPGHPSTDCLR